MSDDGKVRVSQIAADRMAIIQKVSYEIRNMIILIAVLVALFWWLAV